MTAVQQWWLNSPLNTAPFDPHWGNVVLLVRGGSTPGVPTIVDLKAGANRVLTGPGVTSIGGRWGGNCVRLMKASGGQGSGALWHGPAYAHDNTQDGTFEFWFNSLQAGNYTAIPRLFQLGQADAAGNLITWGHLISKYGAAAATELSYTYGFAGSVLYYVGNAYGPGSPDGWTHVCVTTSGGVARLYINGEFVRLAAVSASITGPSRGYIQLGNSVVGGADAYDCKVDDIRFTVGVNRYPVGSGSFTPPVQPFPTR